MISPFMTTTYAEEATSGFMWPLPGELDIDFSNHGGLQFKEVYYYDSCGISLYHPGQDWNVPSLGNCDYDKGVDVLATANGTVVFVNHVKWSGVVIQHNYKGEIWYSQYGHVQNILVSEGEVVFKGDKIAELGDVATSCAHLHFEIREADHPDPTYGRFFCGPLANSNDVDDWYEDPTTFIPSHPAYTTTKDPIGLIPYHGQTGLDAFGVNFSWNNNNPSYNIKNVNFTLAEVDQYECNTVKNYVGDCSKKNIGITNTYSSNSCGTLKENQRYKWWVELVFNDGSANRGKGGCFWTGGSVFPPSDTQKPTVEITVPTSSSTYSTSSPTIDIGGLAYDNVGITKVEWRYFDGGTFQPVIPSTTWNISDIPLQEGTNLIQVVARDAAGNAGYDVIEVTYSPVAQLSHLDITTGRVDEYSRFGLEQLLTILMVLIRMCRILHIRKLSGQKRVPM
jgi:murein DD-endopeptidase MepM/ murein hydrolase activator NlpD